jgi:hypothetical protein
LPAGLGRHAYLPNIEDLEALSEATVSQVFAAAIVVIYNNHQLNNLILSRLLTNELFLGRVNAWYQHLNNWHSREAPLLPLCR